VSKRRCSAVDVYPRPHLVSGRVLTENKRAVGVEMNDNTVEPIMAGGVVLSVNTVHSPTIPMYSGVVLAWQMGQHRIAGIVDASL
jgi:choline dehydrogenase